MGKNYLDNFNMDIFLFPGQSSKEEDDLPTSLKIQHFRAISNQFVVLQPTNQEDYASAFSLKNFDHQNKLAVTGKRQTEFS